MSKAMEPCGFGTDHQDGRRHGRRDSVELFPPQMSGKMKGLFKGLRYISQIFEPNSKEHEMQIGLPTDVKHVAHIGWDSPSVTAPTWMSEFKSGPDLSSRHPGAFGGDHGHHDRESKSATSEDGQNQSSQSREETRELPKTSRRPDSSSSSSTRPRESSRQRDSSSSSSESRHSRRQQQQRQDNDEKLGGEKAGVPRSARKKKTKGSSLAISTRDGPKADQDFDKQRNRNAAADKKTKEREEENEMQRNNKTESNSEAKEDKWGHSENRTRDLSHPKRESYH